MNHEYGSLDPPRTFADRLRQLNDSLQALAARLKDSIASAVSTTLGQAIRDAVRRLLGDSEQHTRTSDTFDREARHSFEGYGSERRDPYDRFERRGGWAEDDDPWHEDSYESVHPISSSPATTTNRWSDAFRTTIQTALWWLRTQPCRKPLLTTALVALTAGGAALIAGPTFAACVSVIASVASLLLTADSARTAGELVTTH